MLLRFVLFVLNVRFVLFVLNVGILKLLRKKTTGGGMDRPSTTYTLFLCPHSHQLYNNNNHNHNNDDGGDVVEP